MSHRNGQHDDGSGFEDPARRRRRKRRRPHDGANRQHLNGNDQPQPANGAPDPTIQGSSNLRNLSEISHLFLSDMRSANGQGRLPPKRIPPAGAANVPPAQREVTVDLTIEEFEDKLRAIDAREEAELNIPPVSAVIGARVNGQLIRRACQYGAGLATELPVGLAIVEAQRVRLMWVAQQEPDVHSEPPETIDDPELLRAALMEMSCDMARWLVVLPDPGLPQARRMLAGIRDWVLLAPADHDGVVAGYRVLKGLCDLELSEDDAQAPRVTLAFVDAADAAQAQRHARKLVGVCKQFLDLEIEPAGVGEPRGAQHPVPGAVSSIGEFDMREVVCATWAEHDDQSALTVLEDVLLPCRRNKAAAGATADSSHETSMQDDDSNNVPPIMPQSAIPAMARPVSAAGFFADDWIAASEDLSRLERRLDSREPAAKAPRPLAEPPRRRHIQDIEIPELALPIPPVGAASNADTARKRLIEQSPATVGPQLRQSFLTEPVGRPAMSEPSDGPSIGPAQPAMGDEVIDLPAGDSVADVVLARLDLAQTAVSPPMLATAKLCVSRDGAIVLVAAASPGLEDLPTIGRAMTWATENRVLLRMALAQYRVDASADVLLHLLVSRADVNADALRPLMSTGRVTVQAYRRLTWGGRCGLLLEAA